MAPFTASKRRQAKLIVYCGVTAMGLIGYGECARAPIPIGKSNPAPLSDTLVLTEPRPVLLAAVLISLHAASGGSWAEEARRLEASRDARGDRDFLSRDAFTGGYGRDRFGIDRSAHGIGSRGGVARPRSLGNDAYHTDGQIDPLGDDDADSDATASLVEQGLMEEDEFGSHHALGFGSRDGEEEEEEDDDDDDRGAGSSDEGDIDPSLYDEEDEDECHESPNTEYWGELSKGVLANGNANRAETARACCESCKKNDVVCNAWVWDPSSRACWMKKTTAYQPPAYDPAKITFTSGALHPAQPRYAPAKSKGLNGASSRDPPFCLHTMITSNGQPYMNWQTRVFYQTWREAASARGSPLRHFTRVLHRTRDDELVNEIHTVRIDPTHPECDNGCDYAVKDRARAIAEWTKLPDARRCSHVLMAETDYLFVRSPPPGVLLEKGHSYGFMFGYIIPWHADAMPASREFTQFMQREGTWREGLKIEDVPQSGNAPQVMHVDDLARVAPTWADLVEFGEDNAVIKKVFGWVRDMYAFDFALASVGIEVHYPPVPFNKLMVQPPADVRLGAASFMHYTWSPILSDKTGATRWRFDKRSFRGAAGSSPHFVALEEQPLPPSWDPDAGYKLQAGETVTEEGLALMTMMAKAFNGGVRALPGKFPEGYDSLADVVNARTGTRR